MRYITIKKIIDTISSLFLIVLLSPLFLFVFLIVSIFLDKESIFKQKRIGYMEKEFYIFKFKTMRDTKDEQGNLLPDHQRLTSLGKILRSLSLDELPQLYNVFKGEMSFIGPRPLLPEYLEIYSCEEKLRHNVLPGITGLAQVNGRNAISWKEKFSYDVSYVRNISLFLDLKIFFLTLLKLFDFNKVNSNKTTTMEKYNGNN